MSAGKRPPAEARAFASALKLNEIPRVDKRQFDGRENLIILFAVIVELPELWGSRRK